MAFHDRLGKNARAVCIVTQKLKDRGFKVFELLEKDPELRQRQSTMRDYISLTERHKPVLKAIKKYTSLIDVVACSSDQPTMEHDAFIYQQALNSYIIFVFDDGEVMGNRARKISPRVVCVPEGPSQENFIQKLKAKYNVVPCRPKKDASGCPFDVFNRSDLRSFS